MFVVKKNKSKFLNAYILSCFGIFFIFSCGTNNLIEVDVGNTIPNELLLQTLEKNDIDFFTSDNKVFVDKGNVEKAIVVLSEAMNDLLPVGRHMSFSTEFQGEIMDRFDEIGIEYEKVQINHEEWIVWEEKDTDKVNKIVYEIVYEIVSGQE